MHVSTRKILTIKTKGDAIRLFRDIEEDQTLLFKDLGERMKYTRQQTYNWPELLPPKIRDQIIGLLTRLNDIEKG